MIDKVSYNEMLSYSKELNASADVIDSLIENKDFKELKNFLKEVRNYSQYLSSSVEMHKDADETLAYLKNQNRTSN